jgi:hypothetical protein
MAHYAFIKDNIVTEVIVGKDEDDTSSLPDGFADWEEYYLTKRPNQDACKRTSYNTFANQHKEGGTPFRGNYASKGDTYDSAKDVFIAPQPYESWVLNENHCWEAPIPLPDNDYFYFWHESVYQEDNNKGWIKATGN